MQQHHPHVRQKTWRPHPQAKRQRQHRQHIQLFRLGLHLLFVPVAAFFACDCDGGLPHVTATSLHTRRARSTPPCMQGQSTCCVMGRPLMLRFFRFPGKPGNLDTHHDPPTLRHELPNTPFRTRGAGVNKAVCVLARQRQVVHVRQEE